jgi:hypothetical protein
MQSDRGADRQVGARSRRPGVIWAVGLVGLMMLAACSFIDDSDPLADSGRAGDGIVVRVDQVTSPFDRRVLGTNVPAWLSPQVVGSEQFHRMLAASGTTLLRLPGGSWSNGYDWLGCEMGDAERCEWTWALRPSDFIDLLEASGLPAMWTASINGTAEEAAAAVAFFNGSVDDPRPIGTDRNGYDWQTVGHWAQLRAANGHPDPVGIRYWEVGNEVYGAVSTAGPDCATWGWEEVWTCEGTEYVEGDADHDGFRRFRQAMVDVDPDIEIGAVGVGARGEWSDWDNEVMAAAADDIDFYSVHHYGSQGDLGADEVLEVPRSVWPGITDDVRAGFEEHGIDGVPIAITEYNLVAFIDGDEERLMTTALNAFYLAETIGEMASNGVTIANQWNFANGRWSNGSDYGLVDAESLERTPAFYAMVLWSRFGEELVAVDADDRELVLYGGRSADGAVQLLVVNPSDAPATRSITVEPSTGVDATVTADVVRADALDSVVVSFNGSTTPSVELDEPGAVETVAAGEPLVHEFPAHSITLLRWNAAR